MTENKKPSLKQAKPTLKKASAWSVDAEVMKKHQQMINFLRNEIWNVEVELKKMKVILDQLVDFDPSDLKSLSSLEGQETANAELTSYYEEWVEVIEWLFDVPLNKSLSISIYEALRVIPSFIVFPFG